MTPQDSHSATSGKPAAAQPARLTLVHGGPDYFERLQSLIASAERELHLQTFIFDDDATGRAVVEALKAAAQRGVRVFVLLDAYGSGSLPHATIAAMEAAGVQVRLFGPWLSWNSLHLGRRLHHKVVVADGHVSLIGGINIADKYHGTPTERAWLDYAVRIDSPAIGGKLANLCKMHYLKRNPFRRKRMAASLEGEGDSVTVLLNDWLLKKNEIYRAYRKAIAHAKEEVIIVGTYFLPGRRLTIALQKAARRGAAVKLILSGTSDVPVLRRATNYLYDKLLRDGLILYEWPHSVLHGKAAVVDHHWTTIGSFNLNQLSVYGSIEMNVAAESPAFAAEATAAFEDVISQCPRIT
ncbi:MAG TPA: phospholipase D-like domain-containing protein, partial [Bacteroidia bacterium]|nr:phospholipase D-like domain-containing protein [Bacteroidia bacterium]